MTDINEDIERLEKYLKLVKPYISKLHGDDFELIFATDVKMLSYKLQQLWEKIEELKENKC
jgi:archaellum component FlaC